MKPERVIYIKTEKQFKALLDYTSNNVAEGFCLIIENETASLIGVSEQILTPISSIIIIRHKGQHYIKGLMDGVYIESSTIVGLNASEIILVGVDCRKPENYTLYYKTENKISKITSNSNMVNDDSMNIFWESGPNACLTVCSFDPVREEVVREVVTAQTESTKRSLRSIIRQFINFSLPIASEQINDFYPEELVKEVPISGSE